MTHATSTRFNVLGRSGPTATRRALSGGLLFSPLAGQVGANSPPPDALIDTARNLFSRVAAGVRLDGKGPFYLVIDTGAERTVLADTVATELMLPIGPDIRIHSISGSALAPSAVVRRLSLGGLRFRDLHTPILPRSHLAADGLIGLDILHRFKLSFDNVARTASLQSGVSRVSMGGELVPTNIPRRAVRGRRGASGRLMLSGISLGGTPVTAFVDSGADCSVGNSALLALTGRAGRGSAVQTNVTIYGTTGEPARARPGLIDEVEIAGVRLGPTPIYFADLHVFDVLDLADTPAVLIGADILSRFRNVIIDLPRDQIFFERLRRRA